MQQIVKNQDRNMTEKVVTQAEKELENAKEKRNEYWKRAKEKGESMWKDTELTRRKAWGQATGFIHKYPGKAVGYSVLLGFMIGSLFYLKRKN